MPDQTVQVSFTAPATWTFDPPEVTMTGAGKIILQRKPGNATWRFVSATVIGNGQFKATVNGNGSQVTIQDDHTSNGTFVYGVTVDAGGTQYSSPTAGDGSDTRAPSPELLSADPPPRIVNAE
jgi:hypothetical protein